MDTFLEATPPAPDGQREDASVRPWYSITEAAALLGVSRVTVWRWIRDGRLPVARLGHRTTQIAGGDLERLLLERVRKHLGPSASPSWVGRQLAVQDLGNGSDSRPHGNESAGSVHRVQFYEMDASLVESVTAFIAPAVRAGDAGLVIATPAHRDALDQSLEAAGLDLTDARVRGAYLSLDAADTLDRFMVDGVPDRQRFVEVVGGIITQATASGRRACVFGEMVALLVAEGNHTAACRLEELWNDLETTHRFSLLCAYPMLAFEVPAAVGQHDDICARHAHVVPAESFMALPSADDRLRAVALLQQKARRLEAEIAERRRAETELRISRDELDAIMTSVAEGITVQSPTGRLLYANDAAARLIGFPSAAALLAAPPGASRSSFRIMDESGRLLAADDLPGRRAMATRRAVEAVLRYDSIAGGVSRWASVRAVPVFDDAGAVRFAVTAFQDITSLKQADEAQRRLAAIVESSDDAIFGKTLDAIITSWNAAAERMYGYTAEEAIGRSVAMLVPPDRADLPTIMARLRRGERIAGYETERVRKDGVRLSVSLTISPIRAADGTLAGASTIARDVTERKRTEAALREQAEVHVALNAALREAMEARDQALADAQTALRVRDDFLGAISHDLRSPLSSIKGLAQLLVRQAGRSATLESDRLLPMLTTMDSATHKMAAMIDELLDLTRMNAGQMLELDRRPTDLVALVQAAVTECQRGAPEHRLEFESAAAVLWGEWDAVRIDRVVANLLSNAVKYSLPESTIAVALTLEQIDGEEWATLTVRDEGLGIPAVDLPQIFDRFHRGANVAGRTRGVGIGLAGCKQIVELHGGAIAADSAEGAGTTMTVRLPCTAVEHT
jgi:PAS domain S-box-containing protein/excisionase family DNA binding protein